MLLTASAFAITIESKKQEIELDKNKGFFEGDVKVQVGDVVVQSPRADLDLEPETKKPSLATFFDTIDRNFFTPDFSTYEHMTFFNSPYSFKYLVIGIYFGLVIASLCMYYNKHVLGGFVRKLDDMGALSEDNAKTLSELDYTKNFFVKLSLVRGNTLRNVVRWTHKHLENVEGDSDTDEKSAKNASRMGGYDEKCDLNTDRFYLIPEKRDVTIQRFRTKGSGWLSVLLVVIVGLVGMVLIFKIAPTIVGLLDNALDSFSTEPDVLN